RKWEKIAQENGSDIDLKETWIDFCFKQVFKNIKIQDKSLFQQWEANIRAEIAKTDTAPNLVELWENWVDYFDEIQEEENLRKALALSLEKVDPDEVFETELENFLQCLLNNYTDYCEKFLHIKNDAQSERHKIYQETLLVWKDIARKIRQ